MRECICSNMFSKLEHKHRSFIDQYDMQLGIWWVLSAFYMGFLFTKYTIQSLNICSHYPLETDN